MHLQSKLARPVFLLLLLTALPVMAQQHTPASAFKASVCWNQSAQYIRSSEPFYGDLDSSFFALYASNRSVPDPEIDYFGQYLSDVKSSIQRVGSMNQLKKVFMRELLSEAPSFFAPLDKAFLLGDLKFPTEVTILNRKETVRTDSTGLLQTYKKKILMIDSHHQKGDSNFSSLIIEADIWTKQKTGANKFFERDVYVGDAYLTSCKPMTKVEGYKLLGHSDLSAWF